jgi:phosphoribosylcarboxyaminoimidazole (NCAIR) mutase
VQVLQDFGVGCEVTVVSAHRTPERLCEFARTAHLSGIKARHCIVARAAAQ